VCESGFESNCKQISCRADQLVVSSFFQVQRVIPGWEKGCRKAQKVPVVICGEMEFPQENKS
jgi:hypothetical protein